MDLADLDDEGDKIKPVVEPIAEAPKSAKTPTKVEGPIAAPPTVIARHAPIEPPAVPPTIVEVDPLGLDAPSTVDLSAIDLEDDEAVIPIAPRESLDDDRTSEVDIVIPLVPEAPEVEIDVSRTNVPESLVTRVPMHPAETDDTPDEPILLSIEPDEAPIPLADESVTPEPVVERADVVTPTIEVRKPDAAPIIPTVVVRKPDAEPFVPAAEARTPKVVPPAQAAEKREPIANVSPATPVEIRTPDVQPETPAVIDAAKLPAGLASLLDGVSTPTDEAASQRPLIEEVVELSDKPHVEAEIVTPIDESVDETIVTLEQERADALELVDEGAAEVPSATVESETPIPTKVDEALDADSVEAAAVVDFVEDAKPESTLVAKADEDEAVDLAGQGKPEEAVVESEPSLGAGIDEAIDADSTEATAVADVVDDARAPVAEQSAPIEPPAPALPPIGLDIARAIESAPPTESDESEAQRRLNDASRRARLLYELLEQTEVFEEQAEQEASIIGELPPDIAAAPVEPAAVEPPTEAVAPLADLAPVVEAPIAEDEVIESTSVVPESIEVATEPLAPADELPTEAEPIVEAPAAAPETVAPLNETPAVAAEVIEPLATEAVAEAPSEPVIETPIVDAVVSDVVEPIATPEVVTEAAPVAEEVAQPIDEAPVAAIAPPSVTPPPASQAIEASAFDLADPVVDLPLPPVEAELSPIPFDLLDGGARGRVWTKRSNSSRRPNRPDR
ncbi:MAG: hypothetical protein QM770_02900 [Tepidisphaeraceae bacterium]